MVLPNEAPLSDKPTFLAPLVQARPHPVQEQLSYAALGGTPVPDQLPKAGAPPAAAVKELAIADVVGGGDNKVPSEAHVAEALPVFSEIEVDSAAARDPDSEGPVYPPTLMAKGIEGSVLATFVVDTSGRPDVDTYIALESTNPLFSLAVRDALPRMKFRPAKRNNEPVRQQVELRFSFRVVKPPVVVPKRPAMPAD
ncbi:MAG: TonB family protein [Gemmatimonadaceae bacterium]|nr:TonB family protein [Gemmatimonadaceae bacterium]